MEDLRPIKPKDGLTVLDPARGNQPLPPHGAMIAWNSWWQRRLDDGDVVETSEAAIRKAERELEKAADAAKGSTN